MHVSKRQCYRMLDSMVPQDGLKSHCRSCAMSGSGIKDKLKSVSDYVTKKVKAVTSHPIYQALSPMIKQYAADKLAPILKEKAAQYTGVSPTIVNALSKQLTGYGLRVAGRGKCCGGALRPAGVGTTVYRR